METWQYLLLLPLGLVAGASGGLLGIGGSVVMIPGMVLLFGPHQQHLYQAAAMIANVFVVAPAVIRHRQSRATLKPVTRFMVPGAVIGVFAGVYASELEVFRGPGQGALQIAFSVFLGYVLAYNLLRLHTKRQVPPMRETDAAKLSKPLIVAVAGLPAGLAGGLLGVGGGLVAVPSQQIFLKVPLPNAIANSANTILWSSAVGAVYKNASLASHGSSWLQALFIVACLVPTAMAGSWFAAGKVHRWPVGVIRMVFVGLLFYCGIRLFDVGWHQVAR